MVVVHPTPIMQKRENGIESAHPVRIDSSVTSEVPASVLVLGNYKQTATVIRSLKKSGFRIVLGVENEDGPIRHSRYVAETWKHSSLKSEPESFIVSLVDFVERSPWISWIFPVADKQIECLAKHIEEIPFRSKIVMPAPDVVLACMDKDGFNKYVSESGVAIPNSMIARDMASLLAATERIGYPCIVKPNNSLTHFFEKKAIICMNPEDLRNNIKSWPEKNEFLVVQKYIQGPRYNCHFVAFKGKIVSSFHYLPTWTDRIDQTGIAVEGITIEPVPQIEESSSIILEKLNYSGAGCIQFILDDNSKTFFFLELNPRLAASCAFPYKLGVDLPRLALDIASCRDDEAVNAVGNCAYPIGKRMHWLFGDIEGLESGIINKEVGLSSGLKWAWRMAIAFVRADVHLTWYWLDPLPTLYNYNALLFSHLRKITRTLSF